MRKWISVYSCAPLVCALLFLSPALAAAADIYVPAGGDLQSALNSAQPGDTVLLAAGATFVGNFTLPVHAGTSYITVRSDSSDTLLPPSGTRMTPAYAPYLAKLQSPSNTAALSTVAGAAYWRIMLLEVLPTPDPFGTGIELGDGSSAQNSLSLVPHHLIVDRVYVHGDPLHGQKRGIGLNSASTSVVNSYIAGMRMVGTDAQAMAGWNGPGPFDIENNYLEGGANGLLFGGDDPKIANLTPSNIVIRGNTLSRPIAWRNPILATPSTRLAFTSGGQLPAGTYGYRVVARRFIGSTTVRSLPSTDVSVTVTAGSEVQVLWNAVPDATQYVVYGRTAGGEDRYWLVSGTSFVDDGTSAGTSGTPTTTATVWEVKNQLELKNAAHVQVDHNIVENNWAQAQTGIAVLFTPRNQYGSCTWCVVEDVTFEYNIIRSIAGAINILGYDNTYPSQQTNAIRIRNNQVWDLAKSWGNSAYFLYMTGQPRDITVDHNTISNVGAGVVNVDGAAVYGFVMTNNVSKYGSYGIIGTGTAPGNSTITKYFPDGVITHNVLAGGSASAYPSGNLFPTTTSFEAHFVDYANNNLALVPGTDWANAGTDGLDLGAAIGAFDVTIDSAVSLPQVVTASLPSAMEDQGYSTVVTASGGVLPYGWSIAAGALPAGVALDGATGNIIGTPSVGGDFPLTVQVQDATGATASAPLSLHVDTLPPVAIVTTSLPGAVATVSFADALQATGGLGSYLWTLSGGSLPSGVSLSAAGIISGTPAQQGSYTFQVTAEDSAANAGSATLILTVAPPPNVPPTVSLTAPASGSVVSVGATVTLAAQATDSDGTVQRVDFYVGGALVGSSTGPSFTLPWLVPTSGTYVVTAVATDDRGASTASAAASISTQSEVVLWASQVVTMVGNYALKTDSAAAGGRVLANPDHNGAKVASALASPASYAEFTFYAEAGRAYHLWLRGYAEKNSPYNDSAFVQFDDVTGALIGTTSSRTVNLEDCSGCGDSGYGWQDDGYGTGVLGAPIYFNHTGVQRVRIQPREDGYDIDQVVLSPAAYLATSPGALKNDATILPTVGAASPDAVSQSVTTSSVPANPWTSTDIGAVTPAGSASVDANGVFTLSGAGADIWGSADAFQFYWQALSGDGEIVARVASVQNVNAWTKAAVMMRDTLDAGSAHAMMLVSPGKGTAFQRRVTAGGLSSNTYGPLVGAPYWVKLVRSGSTFTASVSPDGITWTQVGSDTIAMGSTINVGLVVSSHVNGTLATATFDNVAVTKY